MRRQLSDQHAVARNAADWHWCVRRKDGSWLTRPALEPGAATGNADPWSRVIPEAWTFDDAASADRAARSHGGEAGAYAVIAAPRRGGEWLEGKGAYAPSAHAR